MGNGRTARRARRGLAALVLGWLVALVAGVLLATTASAAATVTIGKTAPAPLTVHPGDTVTFVNGIAPLTVTVPGVVPVTATALTNVLLGGPCGGHTLAPGASYSQTFSQSSTCSINYSYTVQGATLSAVQALLPPLPSPSSLIVTVVQLVTSAAPPPPAPAPVPAPAPIPAPVPAPIPVPAPAPGGGTVGGSGGGGTGGGGSGGGTVGSGTGSTGSGGGTTVTSGGTSGSGGTLGGSPAGSVGGSSGGTSLGTPAETAASSAFDPGGFKAASGFRSAGESGPGSGGLSGSYDGAAVPAFGQLAGLDDPKLSNGAPEATPASSSGGPVPTLPIAALAAVVALSGVIAALVRTHLAARSAR